MVRSHIQLWRRRRRLPLRPPQVTPEPMRRCTVAGKPTARGLARGTLLGAPHVEEPRAVNLRAPRSAPHALALHRFEHPGVLANRAEAPCRLPPPRQVRADASPQPPTHPTSRQAPRASRGRRRLLLLAAAIAVVGGVVVAWLSGPSPRLEAPTAAGSAPPLTSEGPQR